MEKLKQERIGQQFTNNQGSKFEIINYEGCNKVTIRFLDEFRFVKKTQYASCVNGSIKNPYDRTLYGVGYLGVSQNGQQPKTAVNGKITREYKCWSSMMERCYSNRYHESKPTYIGCSVNPRWHSFSNFLEDLPKIPNYDYWLNHPNEQVSLDKDIRGNGSKVYSLDNCMFVPAEINSNLSCLNTDNFKYIIAIEIITGYTYTYEHPIFASVNTRTKTIEVTKCCNNELESANGYIFQWYDVEKDYFHNIQSINAKRETILV